ncbi:hypothetical protein RclHR1_03160004 [Rhizophagus clarus]|uniref:HTH myb-type domain-containing protein n=1 Tax=Rhizophagus clarus TaxID=94130 RepID=A0A2Z6RJD5_9GLOM|nr:hypothetical protein RclHR1_03160004 [Rhizophagus clarus]GET03640.1 hypothetical protein GLOIN_2v462008 [Rhizophagus clarus]
MSQNRELPITQKIDNTIKELIKEMELLPDLGERISEKVNKQYATSFTSNQIRQYLKDKLQIKIPQTRGEPFTKQIDNSIKEFMREFENSSNPYVRISEKINELYSTNYTSKQIRQRWISKLDAKLCLDALDDEEKLFIIQWVESTPRGDIINWKKLIPMMNDKFGKLRSESMVKNFWNLRKRSQESNKSKTENENSRKRKRSSKLKTKDEQQQKKVCRELNITFEYENIFPPPLNANSLEILVENEENIHSPLNAGTMETTFKKENYIRSSSLNVSPPMEIIFENEENIHSPPLNVNMMETTIKKDNCVRSPLLNASTMEIIFESDEKIRLSPLKTNPMESSFKKESYIHLPPLNVSLMEITFKRGNYIHLPSSNSISMKTLFENEENKSPSNAMEILCQVADTMYKRDFPAISTT